MKQFFNYKDKLKMCWSFQVSLGSWIVAVMFAIILLKRRYKFDVTLAILLLAYSSMQLWEALMWKDQKCGKLNKVATYGAYFALYSHVFALGLGLYLEFKIKLPLIVGSLLLLYALIDLRNFKMGCSKPEKKCSHLTWGFESARFYLYVFALVVVFALLYIRPLSKALLISSLFIFSFIFTLIFKPKNAVASYWCWIAVFIGPLFLVLN